MSHTPAKKKRAKTTVIRVTSLPHLGIRVTLGAPEPGQARGYVGGSIKSSMHLKGAAVLERFNGMIDGIEAMVLVHAVAGIDINEPRYAEGIGAAYEEALQQL